MNKYINIAFYGTCFLLITSCAITHPNLVADNESKTEIQKITDIAIKTCGSKEKLGSVSLTGFECQN